MIEPTINCPKCKTKIKVTESLAAPLIEATRNQYEQKIAQTEAGMAKREALIREQQNEINKAKKSIDDQIAAKLKVERKTIAVEEAKKARFVLAADLEQRGKQLSELQEVLNDRDAKLAEAQKSQADLIRKQRELDDAKREMDLTVETKVQEFLGTVRDKAKQDAEKRYKLRVLEKDEKISSMQIKIEELLRKAEQGSQQLQGEVQELELESILRLKFPRDLIEPVAKGEFG